VCSVSAILQGSLTLCFVLSSGFCLYGDICVIYHYVEVIKVGQSNGNPSVNEGYNVYWKQVLQYTCGSGVNSAINMPSCLGSCIQMLSCTLFCLPWLEEDISVTLNERSQRGIGSLKCVCVCLIHQISTQLSTYGIFWRGAWDSVFHHHPHNIKWSSLLNFLMCVFSRFCWRDPTQLEIIKICRHGDVMTCVVNHPSIKHPRLCNLVAVHSNKLL
jgi:hypothetical protein